jgi:hypothetical protein
MTVVPGSIRIDFYIIKLAKPCGYNKSGHYFNSGCPYLSGSGGEKPVKQVA